MREVLRDSLCLVHILEACDRIESYYPDGEIPILDVKSIQFFGLVKNLEILNSKPYFHSQQPTTNNPQRIEN